MPNLRLDIRVNGKWEKGVHEESDAGAVSRMEKRVRRLRKGTEYRVVATAPGIELMKGIR